MLPFCPGLAEPATCPDTPVQDEVIGSFENGNFELDLRYKKDRERWCEMCCQTGLVVLDALHGPQTESPGVRIPCRVRTFSGDQFAEP